MLAVIRSINVLPSQIPHISMMITIYSTIILPVLCVRSRFIRARKNRDRVVWKIFEPQRDKLKGVQREPHNEEQHHVLYSSPNVVRRIESWRMKWAGNMAVQRQGRGRA
jgi:hypothetical protein